MILGESIGVLGVATSFAHYFSPGNIELLTGIGREIAIAVRNAQLYEEASSAKALRELDTMRTEFLANVSHELRTPLAVIKGSANSLLQPDVIFDEQTRREFLVSIDKDADTLTRLVDDLLMMSRLEADALEVNRKPHSVAEIFDSVKDRLESLTIKHHLRINIPDAIPPVVVDDVRIGEVLTNLVENAVKFSDENTKITIEARRHAGKKSLSVLPMKASVFLRSCMRKYSNAFSRETATRQAGGRGPDWGWPSAGALSRRTGGKSGWKARTGKGAKFSFSLPVA